MVLSIPLLQTFEINLSSSGVAELAINRPRKYNALSPLVYRDWLDAIQWAAQCDQVKVVLLTGRGKYYSSGQELKEPDNSPTGVENERKKRLVLKNLIDELINFPKLLIAGVNGNAIGFGVTMLALCDVVYSVPEATFSTPFMKLGFCAEGCSSVLFPRMMGTSKANEMLLLGRTFSAQELFECGFISRLYPTEGFRDQMLSIAQEATNFSREALSVTKKLIRDVDRQLLLKTNQDEMKVLAVRMNSKESQNAILNFLEQGKRKKEARLAKL